eukprot:693084-Amphidinium_carterae.1
MSCSLPSFVALPMLTSVLWTAHLKARAEDPSESVAKKVAFPEREARRQDQDARLRGLSIKGPLEPSRGLIDTVAAMRSEASLKYLSPADCTSRSQELASVKKDDSFMKLDSQGRIKEVKQQAELKADLTD